MLRPAEGDDFELSGIGEDIECVDPIEPVEPKIARRFMGFSPSGG